MLDKWQRVNSYISAYGITVYYIEQYNKSCDKWFSVGDCYETLECPEAMIESHNLLLSFYNNNQ